MTTENCDNLEARLDCRISAELMRLTDANVWSRCVFVNPEDLRELEESHGYIKYGFSFAASRTPTGDSCPVPVRPSSRVQRGLDYND